MSQIARIRQAPTFETARSKSSTFAFVIDKPRAFRFSRIFEPETVSTLTLRYRIRALAQGTTGADIRLISNKVRLYRRIEKRLPISYRERRITFDDPEKNYPSLSLFVTPSNGAVKIQLATLEAPDPRYVYRITHGFPTATEDEQFGQMMLTQWDNPRYVTEPDANDGYDFIVSRIVAEGAVTTDLEDVTNVDDGTGLTRSIQKLRQAIPRDWVPDDGLP